MTNDARDESGVSLRPWRVGRKVGRTIYSQLGGEPSDHDPLIGVMDTVDDAQAVVDAVNRDPARVDRLASLVDEVRQLRADNDRLRTILNRTLATLDNTAEQLASARDTEDDD